MKKRRHHNNKGFRQIQNGKTAESLAYIVKKLKLIQKPVYNKD